MSTEQERPTTKPAPLTTAQRWLAAATGLVCTALAVLGGIGSFQAVADVAARHGFVEHPGRVPLGADLGIIALFLADLLLTWLGMPFPPLRWIAHTLVGATIWFNTAGSWGDPLGMAMHAVAPVLIIAWVEGIRHATRTRARMAARRHIEAAQLGRWLLAPVATARLWRWKAPVMERLVLRFGLEAASAPAAIPASDPGQVPAEAADPGPVPAVLARTFSTPVPLERPALAAAPAAASRPTVQAKRTSAKAKRGGRTDKALEFIQQQRAAGAERPDDLHIQLHRDFSLERTQARRFAERHWPATDPSGDGEAAEEGAA